jgi:glycosyltransferase involved in cell wall biosynthesis
MFTAHPRYKSLLVTGRQDGAFSARAGKGKKASMENTEKKEKINLLVIIGLFHPFVGGAEKECQKVSKRLLEKGISVTVLTQCSDGLPEYEVIDGISVYRKIKGWHLFEISYMVSVLHFLFSNRKKFDVVQCYGLYLFIPPAVLIKYVCRKKVVARIEGPGRFGDFHRIRQLKCGALILASARRLDKIIAVSRDIYREIVHNDFPEKSIVNVPNSVDVDLFQPGKDRGKRRLGRITFVGRLEEEKGLEYLMQALKIVKMELSYVKLFIVGGGQLLGVLEKLRQKLALEGDVAIVGHANDVLSYYQETDVFVLPSLSEGLSLSLLEAMSCALPVVATLVGGNAEIVDPHFAVGKTTVNEYHIGEHGILVNPRDVTGLAKALVRLLKDDALSKQLGSTARRFVENKFSLEKIVKDYVGLYSNLL